MTPFEKLVEQYDSGEIQVPSVSMSSGQVPYFIYQLGVHKFNLSLMSVGMKCRGIKFTDIKKHYGLKGRSAKDCMDQMLEIQTNFINKYKNEK